ncbi:helix-turn-helix transcriptional regulator [Nocardia puris]|uniref:helix-turn-helix transcriptional regulator n=1 Tax=Nocardia puris TaxID=208602 RepID=UPI001893BF86|nr:AraC family transcriptional regulator [Nocardia puris]MBF6210193.1 helix-turn-helix transcriptional regulator [Nocardia puris]MBF6367270.1 helix-turn-helix transcriptional regulator [Nocardia puris]MBF6457454.1 helix-turn-helix transcriptional regulator [Nocardia puris]
MSSFAQPVRFEAGVPVYKYPVEPDAPPLRLVRFTPHTRPADGRPHIHDFPLLLYVWRDGGELRHRAGERPMRAGDVHVIAPGAVVDGTGVATYEGVYGLFFDPGVFGGPAQALWPAWRTHPLLFPFIHGTPGGILSLRVPESRQPMWRNTFESIEDELSARRTGYREAAVALLTLLLVDVGRLTADVVEELRRHNEPLLAAVFDVIETRFPQQLSLRDVADAVGLTPAYLTTVVRKRTGRTVQSWIVERRMTEARHLLTDTDLPVNDIARRVGLPDPAYFTRVFRREHGRTPRAWRERSALDLGDE